MSSTSRGKIAVGLKRSSRIAVRRRSHMCRANIILATADGCGTAEIMRRSGRSKPVVWTWQARFMAEGVAGLVRDKTRKPGKEPLPPGAVKQAIDLALAPPPEKQPTGRAGCWQRRRASVRVRCNASFKSFPAAGARGNQAGTAAGRVRKAVGRSCPFLLLPEIHKPRR